MIDESSGNEWAVGPLLSRDESQRVAFEKILDLRNPWKGTVEFLYPERALHIDVVRGRRDLESLAAGLVYAPWPKFARQHIQATDQHLEIYDLKRKSGFIVRVVRRGIPWIQTKARYDLAEVFVCIQRKPPEILVTKGSDRVAVESSFDMSPQSLMDFAGHARQASISVSGAVVEFNAIRFGRQFMKVGSLQMLAG